MKANYSYDTQRQIYPGEYVPLCDPEKLQKERILSPANRMSAPDIKLSESATCFLAELVIPGLQREDFQVMVDDGLITVCVVKAGTERFPGYPDTKSDKPVCFDQHIHLPANSDPQFASAEYRSGILFLRIPKTEERLTGLHSMIVVY